MKSCSIAGGVIAITVLVFSGVVSGWQESTPNVPPAASSPDSGQTVKLRWKLTPDRVLLVSMKQKMMQIDNADGQINETSNDSTTYMRWQIESVNADGSAKVRSTIERVTAAVPMPDGTTEIYDSLEPATGSRMEAVERQFKPLLGLQTSTTMKPTGEVTEVTISREALNAIASNGSALDEATMKRLMTEASPSFPEEVVVGQKWQKEFTMPLPFATMKMLTTYTYAGSEEFESRKLERIDTITEIGFESAANSRAGKVAMVKQNNRGKIMFDNEAGLIVSSTIGQEITIEVETGRSLLVQDISQLLTTTFSSPPESPK